MDDNFTKIRCCQCGVLFAIAEPFRKNLKENKQSFYCINGHKQSYTESDADRLRDELAESEDSNEKLHIEVANLRGKLIMLKPKPKKRTAKKKVTKKGKK